VCGEQANLLVAAMGLQTDLFKKILRSGLSSLRQEIHDDIIGFC
jgi:hypothetical protein